MDAVSIPVFFVELRIAGSKAQVKEQRVRRIIPNQAGRKLNSVTVNEAAHTRMGVQ